ncbi:MAG: DUF356 domain-containing protein [Methanosarcinaceae archaeon]|nr:DUF356 domain-containing protein [Methanosarcinaceae archaeon]
MKAFAVVRGEDQNKVKIALHDLEQYGNLKFSTNPKRIDPTYADELLVQVVGVELRSTCRSAALVGLENNAGSAINKLRKIHPPAHVVIISPRHDPYAELADNSEIYPEFDRTFEIEA